jgi:hypothetical protein
MKEETAAAIADCYEKLATLWRAAAEESKEPEKRSLTIGDLALTVRAWNCIGTALDVKWNLKDVSVNRLLQRNMRYAVGFGTESFWYTCRALMEAGIDRGAMLSSTFYATAPDCWKTTEKRRYEACRANASSK